MCIQGLGRCQLILEAFCCRASCALSGILETSPSSYVIHHDRRHNYWAGGSMQPHLVIGKQALTLTGMMQKCLQMSRRPCAMHCVEPGQGICLNLYVGGKCSGPSSHPGNTSPALRACVSSSPSDNASSSSSWISFLACIISPCFHGLTKVVPWHASSGHNTELQPASCDAEKSSLPGTCRSHCWRYAAVQRLICGQSGFTT